MPFLLIPFPVFDPIAIALGPFAVRWYALAYIGGIVLGWIYARAILRANRLWGGPAPITPVQFDDFILWVTLGIILGGRTGYVLFYNFGYFVQHPLEIFELWKGGMSFHGGFTGCVLAVVLFGWKNNVPILSLGDVTCAVGPVGLFLGRIANFINSELWGRPADPAEVPWAIVFPNGGPLPRHPSQLYEAGLEGLVLFIVLALMIRGRALKRPGLIIGSFAALYGCARIAAEFFREPDAQLGFLWGGLTMGMLLSLPMIAAGLGLIAMALKGRLRATSNTARGCFVIQLPPLSAEIRQLIKSAGPMPVWRYMQICLTHPGHGYYMTRDPLGREGDFVTAPEVSQMFGELLGLWAAAVWKTMGAPPSVRLVELGPGRGTMMADMLRAIRVMPAFFQAASVHLVEINPALRAKQTQTLAGIKSDLHWHDDLDDVPDGPSIILGNEYFDALPIHQAVRHERGWHERVVTMNDNGQLAFGVARDPLQHFETLLPELVRAAPIGAIFEWRPLGEIVRLARRVRTQGGAALIVDYGHTRSDAGDTFQAIARHSFADPLKNPGQADLTAHVDFQALASGAEDAGARVHGPIEQGLFLQRLGIETRAVTLMSKASMQVSADVNTALKRLTGTGRGGMGALFKVLGVSHPSIAMLAGLTDAPPAQTQFQDRAGPTAEAAQ